MYCYHQFDLIEIVSFVVANLIQYVHWHADI